MRLRGMLLGVLVILGGALVLAQEQKPAVPVTQTSEVKALPTKDEVATMIDKAIQVALERERQRPAPQTTEQATATVKAQLATIYKNRADLAVAACKAAGGKQLVVHGDPKEAPDCIVAVR